MPTVRVYCRRCGIEFEHVTGKHPSDDAFSCKCACPIECPSIVRVRVEVKDDAPPQPVYE